MLRHLGLANKVVIIDECHAYDVYMSQYLEKTLNWLGIYGVPVIVLSATLPAERRKQVIDAYLNKDSTPLQRGAPWKGIKEQKTPRPEWVKSREYPLITYTDNGEVKQVAVMGEKRHLTVHVIPLLDGDILAMLNDLLADGGCAGIIVNTVNRAQALYEIMSGHFGEERVKLLHARFIATDRAEKEKELMELLGPEDATRPDKLIVIGTQVLEQSLDLDFDVMISDLCPMDLLIQRIGRLHRHERIRPEKLKKTVCFVLGTKEDKLESGSEAIYGKYLLMKTRALLPEKIDLPDVIPELVQSVYDSEDITIDERLLDEYKTALEIHRASAKKKKSKAAGFQISAPVGTLDTIVGFLDTDISGSNEKRAEAAVRDGINSIEVIVIRHDGNDPRFLPWIKEYGGRVISCEYMPDDSIARALVGCRVNLPSIFGAEWMIEDTIKELEQICSDYRLSKWQKSRWLKGELFLILDGAFKMELCGYQLKYDKNIGLISKKAED
jgi:CRISPR-associated endonuclease/helicase Cas3